MRDFRFRPPPLAPSSELRWVLGRAFGPVGDAAAPRDTAAAVELALKLDLAARIAVRTPPARLGDEVGLEGARRLGLAQLGARSRSRRAALARAEIARVASAAEIPIVWLKHAALVAMGLCNDGSRDVSDVDVLVPPELAESLQERLVAQGFTRLDLPGSEHQLPLLAAPSGIGVEVHRCIPGLRAPGSRRYARWSTLAAHGALLPAPDGGSIPDRDLVRAHAAVHGLAQHGRTPRAYPLARMLADLHDLAAEGADPLPPRTRAWLEGELTPVELEAIARLVALTRRGALPDEREPAGLLLRHLAAGALDDDYVASLKLFGDWTPMTDGSRWRARLSALGGALLPTDGQLQAIYGPGLDPAALRRRRWTRPLDLCLRAARSARAGLKRWPVAGPHRSPDPARPTPSAPRLAAPPPGVPSTQPWLARRGDAALGVGIGLTVVGSMLAVGSVHPPWVIGFAAIAIATGTLAIVLDSARLRELPPPAGILAGLAAFTALQFAPLPTGWVAALSPRAADAWRRAAALLGDPSPVGSSLSIEPGATALEALKWLGYGALFVAAARLARRRGPQTGMGLVFASAATAALVTLLHAAAAAERLYGIYAPLAARPPWALAPLLNPNNLAGYLNLGFFCGAGWLVTERRAGPRTILALLAAITLAVGVLSASRGGLAALLLGLLLLVPALWRRPRGSERRPRRRLVTAIPLVAAALAGAVLFLLGATPPVLKSLLDETTGKLLLATWARPMIADHLWFGVGRGAYETAFPPYRAGPGHVVYQYAENFVVQWIAEWGAVVGLLSLLGLAWTLRPGRLRAGHHPLTASAAVGLIALFAQNLLDLGLELASIGFAVATVLGTLWGAARAPKAPAEVTPRLSVPAVGLAAAGCALIAAAATLGTRPIETERHRLHDAFLATGSADPAGRERFSRELATALRAHPGDPYLPLLGALHARRSGESALPWINHALERDPNAGRPYLLLAQLLARRAASGQALQAAAAAAAQDSGLTRPAARIAVAASQDAAAILRAAPAGSAGVPFLIACAGELSLDSSGAARLSLLEAAVARAPDDARPRAELARSATALLVRAAPGSPCAGDRAPRCHALVEEQAAALDRMLPDTPAGTLARAELLLATDRPRAALELLAARCERWPASGACQQRLADAADRADDPTRLAEAASRLLAASCGRSATCAAAARGLAERYARRGRWHEATPYFERAARESGAATDWERVADAALQTGRLARAAQAIEQARRAGSVRAPEFERRLDAARRGQLLEGAGPR